MKCPVSHIPASELLSRDFARDPYPAFGKLQQAGGVHQVEDLPWFLVTSYDGCMTVLRNVEAFSSEHKEFGPALAAIGIAPSESTIAEMKRIGGARGNMVDTIPHRDGAAHARQRRLVTKTITSGFFNWEQFIENQTARLLEVFDGREEVDAVVDIAVPLPVAVIANILGVADEYVPNIKRWSDDASRTSGRLPDAEDWKAQSKAMAAMRALFTAEMHKRLENPTDDLVGLIAKATLESADAETGDEPLSFEEGVELLTVLLLAGNETTTQMLGALLYYLAADPDLLERVRANATIIPDVVEEALRLSSPITTMMRFCKQSAEVAGVMIPAGAIVSVCFNQASRDPKVFADAQTFDPHRGELRRHFSFGRGIHVCVGAPLARLEGTVLLKRLSEKVKCLRLAGPDAVRYDWASLAVRGMTSLKVHYALLHGQAGQSGRAA